MSELEEYGIDSSSVEMTKTIRVDLQQFRGLLRDYLRMRGQVTELQTRMSEMVLERQASPNVQAAAGFIDTTCEVCGRRLIVKDDDRVPATFCGPCGGGCVIAAVQA